MSVRRAFSGEGGHFGLVICIDLSMPHARKTLHRNYVTKILDEEESFNKDNGELCDVTIEKNPSYRLGYRRAR